MVGIKFLDNKLCQGHILVGSFQKILVFVEIVNNNLLVLQLEYFAVELALFHQFITDLVHCGKQLRGVGAVESLLVQLHGLLVGGFEV